MILFWVFSSIVGYILIISAFKKLIGFVDLGTLIEMLLVFLIGPLSILVGFLFWFSLWIDPPKPRENSWRDKRIW